MPENLLTSLPLFNSFENLLFVLLVMARLSGMFLISPFWSNQNLSGLARSALMMFLTALMSMTLYADYIGPAAQYHIPDLPADKPFALLLLILMFGKELAVGYLLGFCFGLIFEALLIAGQMVGVMIGLSISEILDPISGTHQSIISQFFTITVSLLIITLDLHHVIIETLAGSFHILPIGYSELHHSTLNEVIHGSARLFPYGLRYAAIPYVVLFLVTFALGFMARIMPEMNIFMVGFPLKIFIGYYGLIAAVGLFPIIFDDAFKEHHNLAGRILTSLLPTRT